MHNSPAGNLKSHSPHKQVQTQQLMAWAYKHVFTGIIGALASSSKIRNSKTFGEQETHTPKKKKNAKLFQAL